MHGGVPARLVEDVPIYDNLLASQDVFIRSYNWRAGASQPAGSDFSI